MSSPDRLTELEIRIAHLEAALDALSDELALQQQRHATALVEIEALKQRIAAAAESGGAVTAADERPPHY